MGVRVIHRLPGPCARIKHNAIAGAGNALSQRDLVGLTRHLG